MHKGSKNMIKYTEEVDQIYDQVGYTGLHQASKYIIIRLLSDRVIKNIKHMLFHIAPSPSMHVE